MADSTTFTVSVEGITETEAAGIHKLCTTIAIAPSQAVVLHVCREQPAQKP
jgi:hypothetical protein